MYIATSDIYGFFFNKRDISFKRKFEQCWSTIPQLSTK